MCNLKSDLSMRDYIPWVSTCLWFQPTISGPGNYPCVMPWKSTSTTKTNVKVHCSTWMTWVVNIKGHKDPLNTNFLILISCSMKCQSFILNMKSFLKCLGQGYAKANCIFWNSDPACSLEDEDDNIKFLQYLWTKPIFWILLWGLWSWNDFKDVWEKAML